MAPGTVSFVTRVSRERAESVPTAVRRPGLRGRPGEVVARWLRRVVGREGATARGDELDDMPRGLPFRRGLILGPFQQTEELEYCDPDGEH